MKKLLVICGLTATGKTALALFLAKKIHGDLLSADSRQVYKGMDIVTGKDIPLNAKRKTLAFAKASASRQNGKLSYWETENRVRIWLTDLVEPTESFSVSKWTSAARKVIPSLWKEKKLPIVVGATGFYISALIGGIETINIPPNEKLRKKLRNRKTEELLEVLRKTDYQRAASLNESDRKNPRRLIRAIEIALWRKKHKLPSRKKLKANVLMIGLTTPREAIHKRIDRRVEDRLKQGALDEVKRLLAKGVSWDSQSMTGTGYRQLKPYFTGRIALEEAIERWKTTEHQDGKKQLTWFKRDKKIVWFDVTEPGWKRQVEKTVRDWYHNNKYAEDN